MSYDAVIIGAGLGGLSAGAFLARAGARVLVLEKTDAVGGRCRSVELMGRRFDIGADYFGARMMGAFRELGKADRVAPVRFRTLAHTEGGTMLIPPGLHTPGELGRLGLGMSGMARLGYRMTRQLAFNSYGKIQSNFELVNFITENDHLRDIFNIGAYFTGNDPENMPSYWFNLIFGRTYGYDRPFYPKGGAGSVPEALAEVIREDGGGIVYDAKPEKIIVEGGRARGVVLGGRTIPAANVVSGVSIIQTVHKLAGKEHFPYGYLNTLSYYRRGLTMASVFVVFRRAAGIRKGVHIYARFARNLRAMFRVLGEGRFPAKSMFVLSCPDAVADSGAEHYAGTVKFLVPRDFADRAAIEAEADRVLADVDQLVPGFYANIVDRRLYAPEDYAAAFGFKSYVTPVAESVHYEKMPVETPVAGLYNVGSTVLPVGGCTASAVESGRACAQRILKGGG